MKKILSLVLALLMSASAASFVGAAEEAAIAPEDTAVAATTAVSDAEAEAQAQYADALALLGSWNILHGKGENNPAAADPIKRYEMALFVSRISTGWTDDSKWAVADQWYDRDHDTSGFDDLEGSGAINVYGALSYASQKGIILGYGNRKFGPEDGITYQDALTMAVRTLGYFNLAWPWGNIEKAVTLGLTKGIPSSVKYTDILNRGQVAQIIYNALFATTKDGDTLAARNFNGDLDWKSIIITVAGKKGYFLTNADDALNLPGAKLLDGEQKLGFKVVNADGTLSDTTYWVKTNQIPGLGFADRLENYLGFAYKALFSKDADSNYVTMEWLKPVQDEVVWNEGRLAVKGEFPIYDYLKGLNLRSKFQFAGNTYLNDWNGNYGWKEIIVMDALQGKATVKVVAGNKYGIDWSAAGKGNIVERVAKADDADYTVKIGDDEAYFKIAWRWNDTINAYFKYVYKDAADGKTELVGIDILDQADIDKMMSELNFYKEDEKTKRGLVQITEGDYTKWAKTAYASLIPFTLNDAGSPNYGLFEEYRLGQFTDKADKCGDHGGDQLGFEIYRLNAVSDMAVNLLKGEGLNGGDLDGDDFKDLYNQKWGKTVKYQGIYEGSCDHGFYWINDKYGLDKPANGSYVIYSVDEGTGEIKIIKVIYDITDEKHDETNFVATGVVRAYNIEKRTVTIGEKTYDWDYNSLADCGLKLEKPDKKEYRAEFTYLFKTLFNQYVNYVVCDGKLVYIELAGTSADLIIVDSYAGLSSDGYIVINGWDTNNLYYRQYKIGSYNGWVKGDYYYYPNQAAVDKAFERGTLYKINSSDISDTDEIYYVSTVALALKSQRAPGSGLYDLDELVEKKITGKDATTILLNAGYRKIAADPAKADWEKAEAKHKYVLICNPIGTQHNLNNGVDGKIWHDLDSNPMDAYVYGSYAPIIVYKGTGNPDEQWMATGLKVNGVGHDTTVLVNVDFNDVVGFNADQWDITYVLFLTYDYETATYDSYGHNKAWYLLGASEFTAQCFNFYTGKVESYIAVNKDLKRGYAYPAMNGQIVSDEVRYDACDLDVASGWICQKSLNGAITAAYKSGAKYLYGHGNFGAFAKLWDKAEVSKKLLSSRVVTTAPAGFQVGDLSSNGTSVFLVDTVTELDTLPAGQHEKFGNIEKITDKEFDAWLKANNFDLASLSYWWIYDTANKSTVFYILKDGESLVKEPWEEDAANALVVKTAKEKYDEDTALITSTAYGTVTKRDGVAEALSISKLYFEFADNLKDAHKFTITGEDHNAIYLDSFEFGDNFECTKNDWNTAVTYDGATADYVRVVGTLETTPYAPHAEEPGCDMIKGVTVVLPEAKAITFPKAADADSTGKATATTTINVNFKDIDREDNEEIYNFEMIVTVTCTFNADGTIATSTITYDYTTVANQLAGDNTVVELQVQ